MKALLTPTEIEFLLGQREFTKDQQYYIKSRILKKVKALYGVELPPLQDKGYLGLAACSKNLAAGCKDEDQCGPGGLRSLDIRSLSRSRRPKGADTNSGGDLRFRRPAARRDDDGNACDGGFFVTADLPILLN